MCTDTSVIWVKYKINNSDIFFCRPTNVKRDVLTNIFGGQMNVRVQNLFCTEPM